MWYNNNNNNSGSNHNNYQFKIKCDLSRSLKGSVWFILQFEDDRTMVSDSARVLSLVITAIKNLRELKGSTSREILHYLSSVYDIPPTVARRQVSDFPSWSINMVHDGVSPTIIQRVTRIYRCRPPWNAAWHTVS